LPLLLKIQLKLNHCKKYRTVDFKRKIIRYKITSNSGHNLELKELVALEAIKVDKIPIFYPQL
jgi:hypothetical protein